MTTKKTPEKKTPAKAAPKQAPFVTCGDCDAKLPEGTEICPKCGYEVA